MNFKDLIKYLLIACLWLISHSNSSAQLKDQQIKVLLRTVADDFLLQIDDSTSRILPIASSEGKYQVDFENKFSFEPDLLLFSVFKIFEEKQIEDQYIVEVVKCGTDEVLYSFDADISKDDLGPCKMRKLPEDCYSFVFTPYENSMVFNTDNNGKVIDSSPKSSGFNFWYLLVGALTLIGIMLLRMWLLNKDEEHQNQLKDLVKVGEYWFDEKKMLLNHNGTQTQLSGKESKLLLTLLEYENQTLERDHILNVVWGDEGNYVGRTLDVFISKLRKKLEADPQIQIVNVRGVGYRFVVG